MIENRYINKNTGALSDSSSGSKASDFIAVPPMSTLRLTHVRGDGARGTCFYNNNTESSFISSAVIAAENDIASVDIVVPENTKYIRITGNMNSPDPTVTIIGITDYITKSYAKLDDEKLDKNLGAENADNVLMVSEDGNVETKNIPLNLAEFISPLIISKEDLIFNGFLNTSTGEYTDSPTSTTQKCTDFIELEAFALYTIDASSVSSGTAISGFRAVILYNSDKSFSRRLASSTYSQFYLQNDEKYIRVNTNADEVIYLRLYKQATGYTDKTVLHDTVAVPQISKIDTIPYIHARKAQIAFILDGEYDLNETMHDIFALHNVTCGYAVPYNTEFPNNLLAKYVGWQTEGFEIITHGNYAIPEDTQVPDATAKQYIANSIKRMTANGLYPKGYIGSSGSVADRFIPTIKKYYSWAATVANRKAAEEPCIIFGTDKPYYLWRYSMQLSTLDQQKQAVDRAIANNYLLLFYGHAKSDNTDYFTAENLDSLLTYIDSVGGQIVNPSKAIEQYFAIRYDDCQNNINSLNDDIANIKEDLSNLTGEESVNLPSTYEENKMYSGSVGNVISSTSATSSLLYSPIDLSAYVGWTVTITCETTASTSNRLIAICDSSEIIGEAQYEKILVSNPITFNITEQYKYLYISLHKYLTANVQINLYNANAEIPKIKSELSAISNTVKFPTNFSWQDNPLKDKISYTGDGISVDFDVAEYKNQTGTTYYVAVNGNDENNGLDSATPLQTIQAAINKEDVGTIVLANGVYNIYRIMTAVLTKSVNIIAPDGATLCTYRNRSWVKTDGYTNVYQVSANLSPIIDSTYTDVDGDMIPYSAVSDIASVDATEHSYFVDNNVTYVHATSSPTTIFGLESAKNIHAEYDSNQTLYLEGLNLYGGVYSAVRVINTGSDRPKVIAKNCKFGYAQQLNSFYNQGCDSILQNCTAMYGAHDGFNYHNNGSNIPQAIEINCKGKNNGTAEGNTYNGSTIHNGGKIIRVLGEYSGSNGPDIADVNTDTESFNIGCTAHDSKGSGTQAVEFLVETGKMWNISCVGYGDSVGYSATIGGFLSMKNSCGSINTDGSGKVKAF